MAKKMSFDDLRKAMLFHKIVEWEDNYIRLDNGMELRIEETEQDCCASADGEFEDVVLDAAITHVSDIQYNSWEDDDTYGCSATVTIMHNRNIICKAIGNADAGNGGYYYSIASFCVKMPNGQNRQCHFVGSDDQ
jgi:hypothetical protein